MAKSRENRQVVFRRIGGHVVPIAVGAGSAAAGVKTVMDHMTVGRAAAKMTVSRGPQIKTVKEGVRFRKAFIRKYADHIKRIDVSVTSLPRQHFWGSEWSGIVNGSTSGFTNSTPDHVAMKRKIRIGVTRRDLTTTLHELGHAEQFRTNSKSVRWRFMSKNKVVRRLGETANEAGAYWRGVKMAKGPAKIPVAKQALVRTILKPSSVRGVGGVMALGGMAAIGYGLAGLLKKPKTR